MGPVTAVLGVWLSAATALPPGFQKTTVFTGLTEPTVVDFTPTGKIYVAERAGKVVRLNGAQKVTVLQLTDIRADAERGLLGMCLDPSFATNGYMYVFYTTPALVVKVVRFTVVNDVAQTNSAFLVWQNPQIGDGVTHYGGSLAFGTDGMLYIASGECGSEDEVQNLGSAFGKILRMRSDGTSPPDNPYINTPGALPYVYARGLRNPFRLTVDSLNGKVYVGDVGFTTWEEVDRIVAAGNFGWPQMEGPDCYVSNCSSMNGALLSYRHGEVNHGPSDNAAVILGPVYRGTAFPVAYRGNIFYGDHVNGWIRRIVTDASGNFVSDQPFLDSGLANTVVDLKSGPGGALYYVGFIENGGGAQSLYKISYNGGSNQPPDAEAQGSPTNGPAPLQVNFSGANSSDPDNGPQPLAYDWAFGDGAFGTGMLVSHTYTQPGAYDAVLTVNDGDLSSNSAPVHITVGDVPVPTIVSPTDGALYRAGDTIPFSGTATDPTDGTLPASAFSWTVVIVHDNHLHTFLGPINGVKSGQFVIPTTGHPPDHAHFRVQLTVTDSSNISAVTTHDIFPVVSNLVFNTTPSGIPVFLDGAPLATPTFYQSVVNFHHEVAAQLNYTLGGDPYHFTGWSNLEGLTFGLDAPEGGIDLTAHYQPGCAADFNSDGFVDGIDYDLFNNAFEAGSMDADINSDGFLDGIDYDTFNNLFEAGC